MRDILSEIISRVGHRYNSTATSISVDMDLLEPIFGFKRMDGKEILLRQLTSSKTEKDLQRLPLYECRFNIEAWAKEKKIAYHFDYATNSYIFGNQ